VARNGQAGVGSEAALQAITAGLSYAQRYNAFSLLSGAQQAVVDAWQQVVMVRGGAAAPGSRGGC
jgi:hypothetical protein